MQNSKQRVKKGFMVKKGTTAFSSKKKRWFILGEETLQYFENESEVCMHLHQIHLLTQCIIQIE
jgi:hypothetical protein